MAILQRRTQGITTTIGGTFNLANTTTSSAQVFDGHTSSKDQNIYGTTGPFTIKFGTGHDNNVYFTGGDQKVSSITGLAGNDHMYLTGGAHGTYTVNLGTGQNVLSLGDSFGSVAYTNTNTAATTYDTLDFSTSTNAFTNISLLATTGAVVTSGGAIADVHSIRSLVLGAGDVTAVTLNNLDDKLTFGNGSATVTGGTGDDVYAFNNFTGTANATQSITDAAGVNTLDFSQTTGSASVNFSSAHGGSAFIAGTGAGAGHSETITFANGGGSGTGISNVMGGSGVNTFTIGNSAGSHSINGGTGTSTLVYNGSQGVTMDVRDHELQNSAGTTDITFNNINHYKILGGGTNTLIGDGSSGATYYLGNGTNYVDSLGGAATVHSDMGGDTTAVIGDGYGAMTVTNTASAGMLTIDASALTHSLGTVTLGVGSASAQIDDSNGNTVTWAATSKVTGFIGNDLGATINGVGNLNFHITGGAGADAITLSGSGNSVVNTGDGDTDAVTLSNAAGDNTVMFGSGNTDTLTASANNGNNSIYLGGGTGCTETLGNGANVVDFSNGGGHALTMGTGADVVQGFSNNNNWSADITYGGTKAVGSLVDLGNYNSTDFVFSDYNGGANVDNLTLTLDANHTIVLDHYFDASATTAAGSAAGTGAFETIHFADKDLTFANVQGLTTSAGVFE